MARLVLKQGREGRTLQRSEDECLLGFLSPWLAG